MDWWANSPVFSPGAGEREADLKAAEERVKALEASLEARLAALESGSGAGASGAAAGGAGASERRFKPVPPSDAA